MASSAKKINEEEVDELIKKGWIFREKIVKGRKYISARMGKRERGFGRSTFENWKLIKELREKGRLEKAGPALNNSLKSVDKGVYGDNLLENQRWWLSIQKEVRTQSKCLFRGDDGICKYWKWRFEPPSEVYSDNLFTKVEVGDGSVYWALKTMTEACWDCPAFMDEPIVDLIKSRITRDEVHPPH